MHSDKMYIEYSMLLQYTITKGCKIRSFYYSSKAVVEVVMNNKNTSDEKKKECELVLAQVKYNTTRIYAPLTGITW